MKCHGQTGGHHTPDYATNSLFVRKLLSHVCEDLLGEGERHAEEDEDYPKNVFPAGNLGPASDRAMQTNDFRITEYVPSSIGVLFRLAPSARGELKLLGFFNVFWPRLPTVEEARRQAVKYETDRPYSDDGWQAFSKNEDRNVKVEFRPIYSRRRVEFKATLPIEGILKDGAYHEIPTEPGLHGALLKIAEEISSRPDCLTMKGKTTIPSDLKVADLMSNDAFGSYLANYEAKSIPGWEAAIKYRAWDDSKEECVVVELLLTNQIGFAKSEELTKRGQETHLFNPHLEVACEFESLSPFQLSALKARNYRVNSTVYASGINCDVSESVSKGTIGVSTDVLPLYVQTRKEHASVPGYHGGAPSPNDLSADPVSHLRRVSDYLHEYARWWKEEAHEFLLRGGRIPPGVVDSFKEAEKAFEEEVKRFDLGRELVSNNETMRQSFALMNRSFSLNPDSRVRPWRLFQLVFIVSNLPGLIERAEGKGAPPMILWYPTGGGKTEAYLGLALTAAFWGRLRGKSFGTTAWTKFPLRLLSMQQLNRVVSAVAFADLVRSEASEIPKERRGDPFSVGLYAGISNSSNDLDFPKEARKPTKLSFEGKELLAAGPSSEIMRKNHKIDRCPMCKYRGKPSAGAVATVFDSSKPGFHHTCSECGYEIPLQVTDTETLRFLPTIIVSTIDKLAELGREEGTKILFGYARTKCGKHGYFLFDGERCNVLGCGGPLQSVATAMDPAPEVVVQDELHFLRETLGAFDSHYETMTLAIMGRARTETGTRVNGAWNIVGSSATIEGYDSQVQELFRIADAIRFPCPGPAKDHDAYSSAGQEEQRLILGFRPQNMSHVDAVLKVLRSYHSLMSRLADGSDQTWKELGDSFALMKQDERNALARYYRTSLAYSLVKAEAGQIYKSIFAQLNPLLQREGCPLFEESRLEYLTGESEATAVSGVLERLEAGGKDWIQSVTATSIIGHGVDLDLLNFIAFRGQPHTVSEWIQAMSRVGRKPGYPSIVVNVYNPNRERDAAFYTHHKKYIEHADTLIRTVPITRYSRHALRKTIRGLFFNAVAYYSEPGSLYFFTENLRRELPKRLPAIRETLLKYYGISGAKLTPKESRLLEALDNELEEIKALLNNPDQSDQTVKALNPLKSLRDVDDQISIVPVYDEEFFSRGEPQ